MDNVTHGLWGIGIYGAWAASQPHLVHSPLTATVFVAAILGSEAPDADYIVKLTKGGPAYLKHHRSASHSIPAWFFFSLLIAGGLSFVAPGHFGLLFGIAMTGVIVHVLLDILTPYGTQALWPFSKHRFRLDILFTIDPVFILLAALGIFLTWHGDSDAAAVRWCFAIAAAYTFLRAAHHSYLKARVCAQVSSSAKVSVMPQLIPGWWAYVVETETGIEGGRLSFGGRLHAELRWMRRPGDAAALAEWAKTNADLGRLFTWFARHLVWQVKRDGAVDQVYLADATYRFGKWLPFAVCISVLKGDSGDWVVGSEIIRGQTVDFGALSADMQKRASGKDGAPLRPEIPRENP